MPILQIRIKDRGSMYAFVTILNMLKENYINTKFKKPWSDAVDMQIKTNIKLKVSLEARGERCL